MDEQTAVSRARDLATREGWGLDRYTQPSAEFVDGDWLIGFYGKTALPGNHFVVVVDDATGACRIIAGR